MAAKKTPGERLVKSVTTLRDRLRDGSSRRRPPTRLPENCRNDLDGMGLPFIRNAVCALSLRRLATCVARDVWELPRLRTDAEAREASKLVLRSFQASQEGFSKAFGPVATLRAMAAQGFWSEVRSPFMREPGGTLDTGWWVGFTPLGTTGFNGRPDFAASGPNFAIAAARAAVIAMKCRRLLNSMEATDAHG